MSTVKRRRSRLEDPLMLPPMEDMSNETSLLSSNAFLEQPIVLGPVVDNGKQVISENSQIHVMDNSSILATDPDGQSNTFIVLPEHQDGTDSTQTILQSIPVYLLIPREDSDKVLSSMPNIKLVAEPDIQTVDKDSNASLIIKDVRTIKSDEEENANYPDTLDLSDDGTDNSDLIIINNDTVKFNPEDLRFKTMFKCDFPGCSETFLYSHERKLHRDVHIFPSGAEYKCSICNMTFTVASDRNKHVESHSIPSTYKCQVCKESFPYYTTLIQHLNDVCSKNKTFKCKYCNILFANRADVALHQQTLHLSFNKDEVKSLRVVKKKFNPVKHVSPKHSDNIIVLD